ncbi:MAG TPA: hypothetical protein VF746_24240 [Longimicrobium sp.]|jgi:hypothetical protein
MLSTRLSVLVLGASMLCAACESAPTGPSGAAAAGGFSPRLYTNGQYICANQSVPSGYVILSADRSPSCAFYSPTSYNMYYIGIPGSQENVCANSPIPSGYVITSGQGTAYCPSYSATGMNMYSIKIPGYEETVCGNSPIPSGYTVVGYTSTSYCPNWSAISNNAKYIRHV